MIQQRVDTVTGEVLEPANGGRAKVIGEMKCGIS